LGGDRGKVIITVEKNGNLRKGIKTDDHQVRQRGWDHSQQHIKREKKEGQDGRRDGLGTERTHRVGRVEVILKKVNLWQQEE